jgi:hypothetical protein
MVCYARPAFRMAALLVVAFVVFGRQVSHYFGDAALAVAITVATAGAAIAAALVFAAFLSTRRRRAMAGGCVTCNLRCQHAMTERPRRPWLVSIADRTPSTPLTPSTPAAQPVVAPSFVPPPVRAVGLAGRSVPVVSINGHPAAGNHSAGNHSAGNHSAGQRSHDQRVPGHLVPRHPAPARLLAGPDAPQWPNRPARRSPSTVGS